MKSRGIVCLIHRDTIHVYWMCKRSLFLRVPGSWMSTAEWDGVRLSWLEGICTPTFREAPLCLKLCVGSLRTQWVGAFWLEHICCSKGGKASPPSQPLRFGCNSGPSQPSFPFGLPEGSLCLCALLSILSFMGFLLCVGKLCLWLGIKNRSISANLILPWVLWFRLFYLDVRL